MGGMLFPYRLNSIKDYIKGFLGGDGTPVFVRDIDTIPDMTLDENKGLDISAFYHPVSEEKQLTEVSLPPTLPVVVH